jgi:hypothetical protein
MIIKVEIIIRITGAITEEEVVIEEEETIEEEEDHVVRRFKHMITRDTSASIRRIHAF